MRGSSMTHKYPGRFIIFDGLDGIGKGIAINSLISHLKKSGLRIFNLHDFWNEYNEHPNFENTTSKFFFSLDKFDVLVSSEPTYVGYGLKLRNEIMAKNTKYTTKQTADAFSNDRLILYKQVVLPALKANKIVVQSRSVSTSIVYQPLQSTLPGETPLSVDEIMALEGNALALENAPNLFIIAKITDASEVMNRLSKRLKDDKCIFEELDFQMKLKPLYEDKNLKEIFESRNTVVKYLDAGISVDFTKTQAIKIYEDVFNK